MKKSFIPLIIVLLFIASPINAQFKIVGYVPNWISLTTFSDNFDYSRVTHLNIAFKDPDSNGDLPALSTGEVYLITQAHANGVKVLLSLCGGGSSENASKRAIYFNLINSTNLNAFASKLKQYTVNNNLDGLDLDLEGTAINSDYGTFVQVLADSLHPVGKLITSALSQGYGGANVPSSTFAYFDWINIMAYDACGPTWGAPGQHSSYSMAINALTYWKGRGLAQSKAVLGLPFYGYEFGSASASNYGVAYNYIATNYPSTITEDEANSGGGKTIYYNGISTIIDKTSLAKTQGGGVMIWELSLDAVGANSLLKQVRAVAGTAVTDTEESNDEKNLSIYPNPSNGIFNIQGINLDNVKLELFNTLGEKIDLTTKNNSIDLKEYPNGIYYLHIIKEEKITLRKIILQ